MKLELLGALDSGSLFYRKQMGKASRRKIMLRAENKNLKKSYKVAGVLQLAHLLAETSLTSAGQGFSRKRRTNSYSQA